jgi:hypothetical protein
MKTVLLIVSVALALSTRAATINAESVSTVHVQAAINAAGAGDTVAIPAGSAVWTEGVTIAKNIIVTGAGTNLTFITNEIPASALTKGSTFRLEASGLTNIQLTHITFADSTNSPSTAPGTIHVDGVISTFRIYECLFVFHKNQAIRFGGYVRGVVDHCSFVITPGFTSNPATAIWFFAAEWAGGKWGDKSWSEPIDWGGPEAVYIENCTFIGRAGKDDSMTDTYSGARIVIRFCHLIDAHLASHGTGDGAGRGRGPSQWEIYWNLWSGTINSSENGGKIRGGPVKSFRNRFYNRTKEITWDYYRFYSHHGKFGKIGAAWDLMWLTNGATAWGTNDSAGIFLNGTASAGTTNNTLVVSGAGWTPNQWEDYIVIVPESTAYANGEYTLPKDFQVAPNFASIITANTSDTITVAQGTQPPIEKPFRQGDYFEIRLVALPFDSLGSGQSDLLLDQSVNPTPVNLNQARMPSYSVLNTINDVYSRPLDGKGIRTNYHLFIENPNGFAGWDSGRGVTVGSHEQMLTVSAVTNFVGFWITNGPAWGTNDGVALRDRLAVWLDGAWNTNFYVPYTYPHPLTTGVIPPVDPPPPPATNEPPVISEIADATIPWGSLVKIPFVADDDGGTDNLTLSAVSSNQSLIPDGNITLDGPDVEGNATITITASGHGSATITITATDAASLTGTNAFTVTVTPRTIRTQTFRVGTIRAAQ